ncbi:MAG: YafY family transcriptional regulator [Xanthomonadales bacterium]|nr:YafY family transcriptional regulator [Xanthomonadales bacterium]ODU92092.1 MAG: DNA-binding transcriptional regulator [Rhodanobacter sp. SCN 66-43]OJY86044.1 MAG: DNA-binding transcriptional regulator [Xanthomonadales bacterium 66-474]
MRRADRLFLIIHALQGRRTALPARRLADTLGVSLRTVYRDVSDLQTSGVAIEGEAGVGYLLRKGSDIPPLMFTAEELEALVVGTRFVRAFAGEKLAMGAQAAMLKIDAVLPVELRERAARSRVFVPQRWYEARSGVVDALHEAIGARRVLKVEYRDASDATSTREIEPLCLACWGRVWTLGAWCRMRQGFRNFRPDRMQFIATGETFVETSERGLEAYLAHAGVPRQMVE